MESLCAIFLCSVCCHSTTYISNVKFGWFQIRAVGHSFPEMICMGIIFAHVLEIRIFQIFTY
jgi:hypothetical protein